MNDDTTVIVVSPVALRKPVLLPPPGWRGPNMPLSVKRQVVRNQGGFCAVSNTLIARDYSNVDFDHRPPIHEREYDPARDDTIPPVNDPDFIRAIVRPEHRTVTTSDVKRMNKVDRLRGALSEHEKAMARKAAGLPRARKGSIPGRGFQRRRL